MSESPIAATTYSIDFGTSGWTGSLLATLEAGVVVEAAGAGAGPRDTPDRAAVGVGAAVAVDGAVLGGGAGPPAGEPWQATKEKQSTTLCAAFVRASAAT